MKTTVIHHSAGPFPTFSEALTERLPDKHNSTGTYQGDFRVGWFDMVLMNYAVECCQKQVSFIAMTNLDRMGLESGAVFCHSYGDVQLKVPESMQETIQQTHRLWKVQPQYLPLEELGQKVMETSKLVPRLVSWGPGREDKSMSTRPFLDFVASRKGIISFAA